MPAGAAMSCICNVSCDDSTMHPSDNVFVSPDQKGFREWCGVISAGLLVLALALIVPSFFLPMFSPYVRLLGMVLGGVLTAVGLLLGIIGVMKPRTASRVG